MGKRNIRKPHAKHGRDSVKWQQEVVWVVVAKRDPRIQVNSSSGRTDECVDGWTDGWMKFKGGRSLFPQVMSPHRFPVAS